MADRSGRAAAGGDEPLAPTAEATGAVGAELIDLVRSAREENLAALLDDPDFDRDHAVLLPILLERKELSEAILERISKRGRWMSDAGVRRKIAAHAHTSRRVAARLLREFHLLDLVQFSLQPATPADARRLADELIVARIGHLPLGQKKTLARRGSASVAGALLADSSTAVAAAALDNSFLTETQVLKALSGRTLEGETVSAIGRHSKWSRQAAVRVAVVTHPHASADLVLEFLPALSRHDLESLGELAHVPASAKQYFQHELARRMRVVKHRDPG
jgi:hypothetical protein